MAGERGQTLYVIAYDSPSDRRRRKIHRTLRGFGRWTQYSLFECFLTRKQRIELQARLEKHLDPAEDSVRLYALCKTCLKQVETIGSEKPKEDEVYVV